LSRMLSRDTPRQRFCELATSLAASHFDLYQVRHVDRVTAQLENARTQEALDVHLTGTFLRPGDRILARVLTFEGRYYICDSPYLLDASLQDWLDYLQRATTKVEVADRPTAGSAKHKLTSKQKAKMKAKQRSTSPVQEAVQHLKLGTSERFWLDYVVDAYLGERAGIVFLAAVPDRPELLPHSAAYDESLEANRRYREESTADALPASHRLRRQLLSIAEREGLVQQAHRTWAESGAAAQLEPLEQERPLFDAYSTLGEFNIDGLTALDLFLQDYREADEELRSLATRLRGGWFSVFRVDRIHLDRGLSVFDVLRRRKLEITERSATRGVANGSLLLGWVYESEEGVLRLEGGLHYVPASIAVAAVEMAKAIRSDARRQLRGMDSKEQLAQLPLALMVGVRAIMIAYKPQLLNSSGDELLQTTGRYTVVDVTRVRAVLSQQYEATQENEWLWCDADNRILATLQLQGTTLFVRVNSVNRLQVAQAHLQQSLGDAIKPSLSSIDGPLDLNSGRQGSQAHPSPIEIPKELRAQLQAMVLSQIQAQFDVPLQLFKGKTLRQLARGKRSRPDAISWLREQERLIKTNPQFIELDLRPLWQELGLEYQGLD
jgi:hypothetical protein